MKRYLIYGGLGAAAAVAALAILQPGGAPPGREVIVHAHRDGFMPTTVAIREGDSVVFENRDTGPHWPASNIHPTHHIYPEFDARRPLALGERWRFRFDRPGSWNYHDHLQPELSGSIVVEPAPRGRWQLSPARVGAAVGKGVGRAYGELRGRALAWYFGLFPDALARRLEGLRVRELASSEGELRAWLRVLGPRGIMARLLGEAGGDRALECHQAAHQIGRVAFELYGAAMFQHGDMSCNAGYYHGAMEAFLAEKGTANLAADVHQLCDGLGSRFARYSCLHGVGHGVMAYENYDLPRAIQTCGRLPGEYVQRSCYSGVFMENVAVALGIGVLPGHQTRWISREDPHFPCTAVDPHYNVQYHCYHFQTSWMLAVYEGDFDRVAAQCLRARPDMVPVCFDSFGRDAATQALRQPAAILALCAKAPRANGYYGKCLEGAVPVITDFWGANLRDQATALCRQAPAEGKPACYTALLNRIAALVPTAAERASVCRGFEPPYRELCGQSRAQ